MHEEAVRQIKALVVDDDKAIADILKEYLSNEKRTVDVCYDGLAAKQAIQTVSYDLIVADMVMPGLSGLDVLKCAKASNPEIIVIIITGYASLDTAIMAVKEGAYDYIRKPFKLDEIKITVEKAVDKINVIRENRLLIKKLADAHDELLTLKREKNGHGDENNPAIHFFSSHMPALQYLYDSSTANSSYVDKLRSLSSLKENGLLTESEFKEFKKHLLNEISLNG